MRMLKPGTLLILVLISSLLLKIAFIILSANSAFICVDTYDYDNGAVSLLQQHVFTSDYALFFRPPLYPLFLALVYLFSFSNHLLVAVIQSIMLTFVALIIYKIAKLLFSEATALIAAAIFAFHPYFLDIALKVASEPLFLLCSIMAIYALIRYEKLMGRVGLLWFSGFCSGLAILTRPTFIIIVPVVLIWLFLLRKNFKYLCKVYAIFVIAILITLSPWIIRNNLVFKEFIYCNDSGGYIFFMGNSEENYERMTTKDTERFKYLNSSGLAVNKMKQMMEKFEKEYGYSKLSPKEKEKLWYKEAFIYIADHKLQWVKGLFLKSWEYMRPYVNPMVYPTKYVILTALVNGILYLLGVIGLLRAFFSKKTRGVAALFLLYFLFSLLVHTFFLASNRYRIVFIDPYLYIFSAFGFMALLKSGFHWDRALKEEYQI